MLEFRNGRVLWSWSKEGDASNDAYRERSEWSFRLPLVKDGIEWGWLNFYHSLNGEALLVDTNYLSDLFRREFTEAAARILSEHEVVEVAPAMAMQMAAKG
jgi:hypothetical protein